MTQDIDEIARFIASQQAHCETRTVYVGLDAEEIAARVREYDVPFVTLRSGADLIGTMGLDEDASVARGWVYGPHVAVDDWDGVADSLFEQTLGKVRSETSELEIGWCDANRRVERFADRHGFEIFSEGHFLGFDRARIRELIPATDVREMEPAEADEVIRLHDAFFPTVWPRGPQMIERIGERRRVFVVAESEVMGYLHAEADPDHGRGDIEFIGVAEAARGKGIARRLIAGALRWMFSFSSISTIELWVRSDNPVAHSLYESVGFEELWKAYGAKKRLGSEGPGATA